jgi:hypothetical protein
MRPLKVEPYLKVYMLVKQDGTYLYPCGFDSNNNMGTGFFPTQNVAELMRTKELLAQKPESTAEVKEIHSSKVKKEILVRVSCIGCHAETNRTALTRFHNNCIG